MAHVVSHQDMEEHRPALIAWAEANGLDPNRIAIDDLIIEKVGDRQVVSYTEYVVDADGRKMLDLTTSHRYQTVRRTRTLRQAFPECIGQPLCTCVLDRLNPARAHAAEPDD